jgi:phosphate-selective porin OprO/OprP
MRTSPERSRAIIARAACAAGLAGIVCAGAALRARAQDQPVVNQLLEILRKNKEITPQQYEELKAKAAQEQKETEDLREMKRKADLEREQATKEALAATKPSPDTLRAYFKNGWNLETADGNFKLVIGGFIQNDWNVSDPSTPVKNAYKLTGTSTGTQFRRARLSLAGLVYSNIDFKFEYDFAEQTGGNPSFKDVYVGMNQIPVVQYLRVGHFKEPFSLEELTPDTYTTFMERANPINAFAAPGSNFNLFGSTSTVSGTDRNTGIAAYQTFFDQRLVTATGAFRASDNFGNGFGADSPYDVTARISGLPLYDVGQDLLHLGFSYSHKFRYYNNASQETISFSTRPESNLFPTTLVNTGFIPTDGVDLFNPEFAVAAGPFEVQGEYTWALVDLAKSFCSTTTSNGMTTTKCVPNHASNPQFGGGYLEASYFLTGESRASFYRTQFGHFERVIPLHNFAIDGSHWGAWQVAVRYSYLDLQSASINHDAPPPTKLNAPSAGNGGAGALDDITGGINWYLNPVTRISLNYVWAHRESIGDSNIVQGRVQLAF